MRAIHKKRVWDVIECRSFWSQARGWMFRWLPKQDGLLFVLPKEMSMSLHMFFCFRSLDILYLNKQGKVVKVYKNVRPFVPYVRGVPAWYILEVKDAGSARVGDKVRFISDNSEIRVKKR